MDTNLYEIAPGLLTSDVKDNRVNPDRPLVTIDTSNKEKGPSGCLFFPLGFGDTWTASIAENQPPNQTGTWSLAGHERLSHQTGSVLTDPENEDGKIEIVAPTGSRHDFINESFAFRLKQTHEGGPTVDWQWDPRMRSAVVGESLPAIVRYTGLAATRSSFNDRDMTYVWDVDQDQTSHNLNVTCSYGAGTSLGIESTATIPYRSTDQFTMEQTSQNQSNITVDGKVRAVWAQNSTSYIVLFIGQMIRPGANNVFSQRQPAENLEGLTIIVAVSISDP